MEEIDIKKVQSENDLLEDEYAGIKMKIGGYLQELDYVLGIKLTHS